VNDQPAQTSFRSDLLRLLTPLAALAAMASFAAREADPAGAAESAYLAVLAAAALLPVGVLAPWPAFELGLGSALATAAVWALPPGPGRGMAVVMVLLATLAVAAARAFLSPSPGEGGGRGRERGLGGEGPKLFIPLALGLQVLLRGDLLFHPALTMRAAVALVVLPVAGGLAVSLLARRHGVALALIAGGAAVALAPGFNVAGTLALIALMAGDLLAWEETGRLTKVAAGIALLAPIAWAPGPGIVAAVCGLALWRPRIALGIAVAAAAGLALFFHESWRGIGLQILLLLLLVPAAVLPGRDRIEAVLAAALMLGTVPPVPGAAAFAAPLALAALSLRREAAFTVPQGVWTGAALGGTALLAGYPWLREEPLASALGLLGLPIGPRLAIGVAAVLLALAGVGIWMRRRGEAPRRSVRLAGLAAACLGLALLAGLPGRGTDLLSPGLPVVLDAAHPAWEARVPRQSVGSVVVESSLSHGAGLAPGTPVAVVRLRDSLSGSRDWTLRAGRETGEWAVRRPDVARLGTLAPSPWVSWVAGDFFAQRYRSRWTLPWPGRMILLRVERAPGVPPELAVTLYQVEIRK
jgi:hypothetical protein